MHPNIGMVRNFTEICELNFIDKTELYYQSFTIKNLLKFGMSKYMFQTWFFLLSCSVFLYNEFYVFLVAHCLLYVY